MTHRNLARTIVDTGNRLEGTRYYRPYEKNLNRVVGFYRQKSMRTGRTVTKPITAGNINARGNRPPQTTVRKFGEKPPAKVVVIAVDGTMEFGTPKGPVTVSDIQALKSKGFEVMFADPAVLRPEVREKVKNLG